MLQPGRGHPQYGWKFDWKHRVQEALECPDALCLSSRIAAHGKKLHRSKILGVDIVDTW